MEQTHKKQQVTLKINIEATAEEAKERAFHLQQLIQIGGWENIILLSRLSKEKPSTFKTGLSYLKSQF